MPAPGTVLSWPAHVLTVVLAAPLMTWVIERGKYLLQAKRGPRIPPSHGDDATLLRNGRVVSLDASEIFAITLDMSVTHVAEIHGVDGIVAVIPIV